MGGVNRVGHTHAMILSAAPRRFVLKLFSVRCRGRARNSVPSGCLGQNVVQISATSCRFGEKSATYWFSSKTVFLGEDGKLIFFIVQSSKVTQFAFVFLYRKRATFAKHLFTRNQNTRNTASQPCPLPAVVKGGNASSAPHRSGRPKHTATTLNQHRRTTP